jgi:DNA invertase Pin-like site-specific DNA recombinase
LVAKIVMSVAEWEREIIAERTREALAEARDQGIRLGRPVLVTEDTVKYVRRLRNAGRPLQYIADRLNREGVPTVHSGTAWGPSTLRGVLR